VEAPRVAPRPGGFWAAWVVNAARRGIARVYDPAGEGANVEAYGTRFVEVVALDESGQPAGDIRRLRTENEKVVGFDLTTAPSGNAWVALRQDAPSPVASGGRILVTEVGLAGVEASVLVRQDDVGAGEPIWLSARGEEARWLTFPNQRDGTLLMRVEAPSAISPPLHLDTSFAFASALAVQTGHVLFALPRGRAVELFSARCAPNPLAREGDAGLPAPPRTGLFDAPDAAPFRR
jgi:hypothetical protein